jgi:hypothetical protein
MGGNFAVDRELEQWTGGDEEELNGRDGINAKIGGA